MMLPVESLIHELQIINDPFCHFSKRKYFVLLNKFIHTVDHSVLLRRCRRGWWGRAASAFWPQELAVQKLILRNLFVAGISRRWTSERLWLSRKSRTLQRWWLRLWPWPMALRPIWLPLLLLIFSWCWAMSDEWCEWWSRWYWCFELSASITTYLTNWSGPYVACCMPHRINRPIAIAVLFLTPRTLYLYPEQPELNSSIILILQSKS